MTDNVYNNNNKVEEVDDWKIFILIQWLKFTVINVVVIIPKTFYDQKKVFAFASSVGIILKALDLLLVYIRVGWL